MQQRCVSVSDIEKCAKRYKQSAMKDGAKSWPSGLLFAESGVVWRVLIAELS